FGSVAAAPSGEPPGLQRAIEAKEKHVNVLLETPGIVAVGVGHNGAGNPSVIVFTETRGVRGIPAFLDGVPVISQYSGPFYASPKPEGKVKPPKVVDTVDPTARFERPVPIGVSTGHPDITAGTIGARVVDNNNNVYALSNNHVYANSNNATIGDVVIQPGTVDKGTLADDGIGTLSCFVPIAFNGTANTVDAAIALTSAENLSNSTPSDGYGVPESSTAPATINLRVMKYGRTTGQTSGRVYALNASVEVNYGTDKEGNPMIALFNGQIIVTPGRFSAGGDSGSLIVDSNKNPVGLLFAGSSRYTIANPIQTVLNELSHVLSDESDENEVINLYIDGNQEKKKLGKAIGDRGELFLPCVI
ncbi:MAG: hypothetical protein JSU58_07610, partial [Dehalococcoidales bacterium]